MDMEKTSPVEEKNNGGNIKALRDYVFIEPVEEKITDSGIITSSGSENPSLEEGIVRSIGENVISVEEGDNVMYKKFEVEKIRNKDKVCALCKEESVIAIINEK